MLQKKCFTLISISMFLVSLGCGQKFQAPGFSSSSDSSLSVSEFTIEVSSTTESVRTGSDVLVVATIVGDDKDIQSYNWQKQNENGSWDNIGDQNLSLRLTNVSSDDAGIYQLLVRFQTATKPMNTFESPKFELIVQAVAQTPNPTPAPANCGSLAHGASQNRLMYQAASVVAPSTCNSESQVRVCTNGVLSDWSPNNFQNSSCIIQPAVTPTPQSCGNLAHGALETRVRYRDLQVVAPSSCQQETQTRTCNNGNLSNWSPMNYFNTSCMVNNQTPVTAAFYVSPTGSDTNAGGINSPFRTFARAYNSATAGTTIYLRSGVYAPTVQLLLNRSGASGNPIRVFNYPGEVPVIDGMNMSTDSWTQGAPLRITGNWNHVKGLEVRNGPEFGAVMDVAASNNVFEQLNVHHSGRLSNWEGKGIAIFGSGSNNMILNCDSHHNRDLRNDNADGFMVTTTGSGTVLRGNRAWRNSDDGYDFFNGADNTMGGVFTLEDNWAFENGYDDNMNFLGDGNGFKLGGRRVGTTSINGGHLIKNCVAWGNRVNGFDDNGWNGGTRNFTIYNNTSFNNGRSNYAFTNTQSLFKNNISVGGSAGVETQSGSNVSQNSWTLPVTANSADFASTSSSIAAGPRNADGSLPSSNFLRLAAGSDLINIGVDVGQPYNGSSPDLGAFEW